MPRVHVPTAWRDLTRGDACVELPGGTLREIVAQLESRFPGIAERATADGAIAPGLAVSIDGVVTSRGLATPVAEDCEIHFLPAIGGG